MLNNLLKTCFLTGALLSLTPAWAQNLPALKSVKVDLPAGDSQFRAEPKRTRSTTIALPAIPPTWC